MITPRTYNITRAIRVEGGKFAVGETQCTFPTREFSLVSARTKETAEIRKISIVQIMYMNSIYIFY